MKLKTILSSSILAILVVGWVVQPAFAQVPGMVSYWKFDEGEGVTAYDSIAVNHGDITGADWITGIDGSALTFEGVGYVNCGSDSSLDLVHEATIEFWIRPAPEAETHPGLVFGKGEFNKVWWGTNIDDEMGLTTQLQYDHPDDFEGLFTPGILHVDEWQHITWRFDHGNMKVYRNAQLYAEAQMSRDYLPDVTGGPFMLGFPEDWHATYFDLDELAVYNRALTDEEIQQRYERFLNVVWLEYNTGYWYSTRRDTVVNGWVEGQLDGYASIHNTEDPTGLSLSDLTLDLELTEGLEAESWSPEWWVESSAYRWEFPELVECQGAGASMQVADPIYFNTGCDVTRTVSPDVLSFPGGEVEFTFTFTPREETLNWAHFHIGFPSDEALFDAIITSPTTDPEKNIWLTEDQRSLWIQISLGDPEAFQPHTFTVKFQVTVNEDVTIHFMPGLHVDARMYFGGGETFGSNPPPNTKEIGTWTFSAPDDYLWRWQESIARNVGLEGYWELVPPELAVKLSGEFDYLQYENIKIRLAALVTDVDDGESKSGADVTLDIYDENGGLLVSTSMVEKAAGTGIYEWASPQTIRKLMMTGKLEKGVYLAHVRASVNGGPTASDVLLFHIDPPGEDFVPPTSLIVAIFALLVSIVAPLIIFKQQRKQLSQRTNV